MTEDNPAPYKYAGLPLTPNVIADLAPLLVPEPLFRRAELIAAVEDYHESQGGLPSESGLTSQVKKALQVLQKNGSLEPSGGYGTWRWLRAPEVAELSALVQPELSDEESLALEDVQAEGEGQGSMYVYYFPAYKDLAELRGEPTWPVKVGMTAAGNATVRVADQQGTAMPERPVLAYVRKTSTPRKLETAVQAILFFRGRQIEDAAGDEWFDSSPDEVRSIVNWIHGEP
ncbi:GIY-YIG nuclease family protein [Pseudarthrobacter sp. H3Y2-7]|nr:GIY-YIG nuclease family protein [Pseudarthrobacter sp. H3Y2-7]